MHDPNERPQLQYRGRRPGSQGPGLLTKIVAVVGGALVLLGAVAVSIVVFAVVAAVGLLVVLYLWWKTRDLRKHMKAQMQARMDEPPRPREPAGEVIEGEFVRKDDPPNGTR